ncbi:hypothetical protein [Rubritalea sp.]|uniref:hypothetical protein n=1 Tax=Rubritalea sp. TaxID=2109375 RepID=UPI003EF0CA96
MRYLLAIFIFSLPLSIHAQEDTSVPEQQNPITYVKPEITTRSIFPDRLASALVYFDTVVEQPYLDQIENDSCRIVSVETYETDSTENAHQSAAIIQFQVRKAGIAMLPSVPFESETKRYESTVVQFMASEPMRSEAITLTITPEKSKVYVGEPVRFDLTWESSLHAPALQNLRLNPSFFSNEDIEVVIPRNTEPENSQVGLPIGGRRVIATRELLPEDPKALGKVTLPIYLRFNKAGTFDLPPTKLEISKLARPKSGFAQYVAHFNNSFFVPTEEDQLYDRLYNTSQPIEVEVLPLPTNELTQNFTGLFSPTEITIDIKPSDTVEIGQVLELELNLKSEVPGGFLELQELNEQPNLDERFLITGDFGKVWHQGATSFKQRMRILSTSIQSIPPLDFTIFNIDTGNYEIITTPSIPLTVNPYQNQDTISLANLNATQTLSSNPEGIWYNNPINPMNDFLQQFLFVINKYFWVLLSLIPVISALLIPLVREARKRSLNAAYKQQAESYKAFLRAPQNSQVKWDSFLAWLASYFQANNKAWTYSDTSQALKNIKANEDDLVTLTEIHQHLDKTIYTETTQNPDYSKLTDIAKRLSKLLPLILLSTVISVALSPLSLRAAEWEQAEKNFQQAQTSNDPQLYSQAALLFEEAAKQQVQPATSWYNAGNAWFQAGELGRSIAAYRHAQQLSPWDEKVSENLTSARALVATEVALNETWWDQTPLIALKVTTLCTSITLFSLLLATIRYRNKKLYKYSLACGIIFISLLTTTTIKIVQQNVSGVITTNKVNGRKGPSYAYASAFDNSLKDGLEFSLIESRDSWLRIQLLDKRECWVPSTQVVLIK